MFFLEHIRKSTIFLNKKAVFPSSELLKIDSPTTLIGRPFTITKVEINTRRIRWHCIDFDRTINTFDMNGCSHFSWSLYISRYRRANTIVRSFKHWSSCVLLLSRWLMIFDFIAAVGETKTKKGGRDWNEACSLNRRRWRGWGWGWLIWMKSEWWWKKEENDVRSVR